MGMDLDLVEVLVMVVLVEVLVMGDLEDITTMKQQPLKLQKPITLLSTTTITQSLLLKTYLVVFLRTTLILDMLRGMMEESLEVDMMMETEAEETRVLDLVQGCWLGDFLVMVLVE